MQINMGRLDQVLRLGISAVLIYVGFFNEQIISDILSARIVGAIGVASLLVAVLRFCPLYTLAGITTCPLKNKSQDN